MSKLQLYVDTVRHLRPIQVLARIWFRCYCPRPNLRIPPFVRVMRSRFANPIAPAPTLLAPQVFKFLNVERPCATAADWTAPEATKLWTYNLHYFDDLNALEAPSRLAWHLNLLARWVAENPPAQGDGWEPYPVSRRIVNWCKWSARGHRLPPQCHASLAVQARWLSRRLEYHLLGNHLLANAKALVFAGLYFDGAEADRWHHHGLAIVNRELRDQVLSDGGHFEGSPMYHAAVLEDLLDLINFERAYEREPPAAWLEHCVRMQRWLGVMSHPDGNIAFFNDAAFGMAPACVELEEYMARLDLTVVAHDTAAVVALVESGYVRALAGDAYLVCDCAPVGPNHLPGHAHADTLSFELSHSGRRIFVNSGTSEYGTGIERQRQRGTAAHNTVVVDGEDSSQVWGGFRVAKRARARLLSAEVQLRGVVVEGSHDGYRRLPGRNVHRRRWTLDQHSLQIEDHVSGEFVSAVAWFHLHPEVQVRRSDAREVVLAWEGGAARMICPDAASLEVRQSTWHPRFGIQIENRCIVANFSGAHLTAQIFWMESP